MKLSKKSQSMIDNSMSFIHNGHIGYGCRGLASLHRCGNTKERMVIEEYRDNNEAIFNATEIINGCMVIKGDI